MTLTSTTDQNPQTKELQATLHLEPSTSAPGGEESGTPRPSQEATGIPSLSGRAVARGARRVSRLKASDGLEEAGEAAREAFKRGLFQAPPEAST